MNLLKMEEKMMPKISAISAMFTAFTLFYSVGVASVAASNFRFRLDRIPAWEQPFYVGDFCWEDQDGNRFRLGITHMGGGHFSVGVRLILNPSEPDERHLGVHGGLEMIQGKIHINLISEVDYGPDQTAGMGYISMVLDPVTWSGSSSGLGLWTDGTTGPLYVDAYPGTVNPVPCFKRFKDR